MAGAATSAEAEQDQERGASSEVQLLEEVVALVVDDDEGREILDLDAPDRLHAEFGIFEHLDLADAVLGQPRGRAADRAEIEAAMAAAGVAHGRRSGCPWRA